MRVATIDGLVTLFYDGSREPFDEVLNQEWQDCVGNQISLDKHWIHHWESWNLSAECKEYTRERLSWQRVIIVEGVTEIPEKTFLRCYNIKQVTFADTVIRIERNAFTGCENLTFIKFPINIQFIGGCAFHLCNLSSVFIPPRCREIGGGAFYDNKNLTIFNVPQGTQLQHEDTAIGWTMLHERLSVQVPTYDELPGYYHDIEGYHRKEEEIIRLIKNIHANDAFSLHRVCSSFEPTLEMILETMEERGGLAAFQEENSVGITPSRYLKENPYANVKEKEVVEKYVLQMMGEL